MGLPLDEALDKYGDWGRLAMRADKPIPVASAAAGNARAMAAFDQMMSGVSVR